MPHIPSFSLRLMDLTGDSMFLPFPDRAKAQAAFDTLRYSDRIVRLDLIEHTSTGAVSIERFQRATGAVVAHSRVRKRD